MNTCQSTLTLEYDYSSKKNHLYTLCLFQLASFVTCQHYVAPMLVHPHKDHIQSIGNTHLCRASSREVAWSDSGHFCEFYCFWGSPVRAFHFHFSPALNWKLVPLPREAPWDMYQAVRVMTCKPSSLAWGMRQQLSPYAGWE